MTYHYQCPECLISEDARSAYATLDMDAAIQQGWVVSEVLGYVGRKNHRPWEVQVWEEASDFATDEEVWKHLRTLVDSGDPLALSVKAFLQKYSPDEFADIFGEPVQEKSAS